MHPWPAAWCCPSSRQADVPGDPRSQRRPAAVLRGGDARRQVRAARRDRSRRHRRRDRPRRAHAARGALPQGGHAHVADEGAAPLPEKWHGLQDPGPAAASPVPSPDHRSGAATVRRGARHGVAHDPHELDSRGYTEVETPILQAVAGGALAKPFTTHHNALDTDLKLRISLELYLKRLLVGGLERIYEIGRNFRNEGIDREHNPEFTMLELYEAYGDYETMMRIAEDLIRACAMALHGSLELTFRERPLDLAAPFHRVTVLGSLSEATGGRSGSIGPATRLAEAHHVSLDPVWAPARSRSSSSRSSWNTRSSSPRSSATSPGRSRRSRGRTAAIRS